MWTCNERPGGTWDPAESRKNDPRQKGLAELSADGRGALGPRAKLVAERERSGGQKKRPAPGGADRVDSSRRRHPMPQKKGCPEASVRKQPKVERKKEEWDGVERVVTDGFEDG